MASSPALTTFAPGGLLGTLKQQKTQTSTPATLGTLTPAPTTPAAPAHPDVATPSATNVTSHTYTTNPDGTTTTQIKYAPTNTQSSAPLAPAIPAPQTTFGGLVGSLANTTQQGSPAAQGYTQQAADYGKKSYDIGQEAQDIASQFGQRYADIGGLGAKFRAGQLTTGTTPVAEGNAAITAQTTAAQQAALAAGEQAALQGLGYQLTGANQAANAANAAAGQAYTGQGQTISGLTGAAGLAQPQLGAIGSQQYYNPLGTAGQATGGLDPQTQAAQLAQEVANGTRTYQDAVSAIGAYGGIGTSYLNNAIRQVSPDFNFAQASALGATQGQVAPQLQQAQLALDNLTATFGNTPWFQKFGVPALNTLTGLLSEVGVGTGSQKDKENAISEARTQVSNALGVATNTTPSAWTATVQGWFPDNATPQQISAGIEQFNNLAKNRQQIYGTPGSVQPYSPSSTSSGGGGGIYDF